MGRRSARNASTSSGVIWIALRWFTPWPMASVIVVPPTRAIGERNRSHRGRRTEEFIYRTLAGCNGFTAVHLGFLA